MQAKCNKNYVLLQYYINGRQYINNIILSIVRDNYDVHTDVIVPEIRFAFLYKLRKYRPRQ